jgi:hypothetical protein
VHFLSLPDVPFNTYTEAGVTFTPVGGGQMQKVTLPGGDPALTGVLNPDNKFPKLRAYIEAGATSVSVLLGKGTWGDEPVSLKIYDSSGSLLDDPIVDELTAPGSGTIRLSADAPPDKCITYAIFGASEDPWGSSVYVADFTFDSCPCPGIIPAPGAILLTLWGAGLIGHLRRRGTL